MLICVVVCLLVWVTFASLDDLNELRGQLLLLLRGWQLGKG